MTNIYRLRDIYPSSVSEIGFTSMELTYHNRRPGVIIVNFEHIS